MTMERETRKLYCILTESEARDRGKALAENVEKYNDEEAQMKANAETYRGQLKNLRANIDSLARVVETGKERRDVECFARRDETRAEMATFRADTGEELDRRPMTAEERQAELVYSGQS